MANPVMIQMISLLRRLAQGIVASIMLVVFLASAIGAVAQSNAPLNAGSFAIVSHNPLRNALDVANNSLVTATFNGTLNTGTVSTVSFNVRSSMTARYNGVFSFPAGDQLQFTPFQPFKPGETVFVTASSGVENAGTDSLKPYTWQFTAAAGHANGVFTPHPTTPTFGVGDSFDVALGDLDGDGDLDAVVANYSDQSQTVWLNDGLGNFSPHPVTPSFGTGISVGITLGDLDGDGDLDAVVANYIGQPLTVWLNDGAGNFSPHPVTPSFGDGWSIDVALGDLDGDGDLDAVVASSYQDARMVWLNDGAGNFSPHPTTPAFQIGGSYGVALGDLDSDGDLDAVVLNYSQPETVWLNDGEGNFIFHQDFDSGDSVWISLGDLDADGDLDALVCSYDGHIQLVWLNDGAGNFSPHPTTPSFSAGYSGRITLGDLDGDGDLDGVSANYFEEAQTVWLNDGAGNFSAHPTLPSFGAGLSNSVALGDLDGDGDLDAVVANYSQPQTVWLNNSLLEVATHSPETNALGVAANTPVMATFSADLNTTTVNTSTFTIYGQFSGQYNGAFSFPADNQLHFTPAQLFKPGETVFVTGSSGVKSSGGTKLRPYTWQFTTAAAVASGAMTAHPTTPSFGGNNSFGAAWGDLDGDGDLDMVVANLDNDPQTVWLNDGLGNFSAHPTTPTFGAGESNDVALGDIDGDGDLDAVVANGATQAQTVWLNDGAGNFSPHPSTPSFGVGDSRSVELADLDGDGDLDAVVANDIGQAQTVWLNDGSGNFSAHPTTPSFGAGNSWGITFGDLDSDGDLDAVVANESDQANTVWLNNGGGAFSAHPTTSSFGAGRSYQLALGDIDGDGDLDAVVANWASQAETVWLNDGAGNLSAHPTTPSFGAGISVALALGDIDGDGDLDVVVANSSDQPETVWLNDGAGNFTPHPTVPSFGSGFSRAVVLADLDGDGDLDVAISNGNNQAQTVWLNTLTDLELSKEASTASQLAGSDLVYSLTVTNNGPDMATGITLTDTLSLGMTFLDASTGCSNNAGLVSCDLGSLVVSSSMQVTISVCADAVGMWSNLASVSADQFDDNLANNSASVDVTVNNDQVVYENDFESPVGSEWCSNRRSTSPSGRNFLGDFSRINNVDEPACLSLSGLPAHNWVRVAFELFVIRSWNGNGGFVFSTPAEDRLTADRWLVNADGQNIFISTFGSPLAITQAYPGQYPGGIFDPFSGAAEINSLGYTFDGQPMDSVYQITLGFLHSSSTLQLDFTSLGLQSLENESWGLDNIVVTVLSGMQLYLPTIVTP